MNRTADTIPADGADSFGPTQAAALLTETTQQTRRDIEPAPPWLLSIRGVFVLAVGIAVWLSVRHQHPYHAPTAAVVPVCVIFGILNTIVTLAVAKRATVGIAGRSRLSPVEIAILAVAWLAPFVAIAPLASAGVRPSIVYGVLPAAVPLLSAGVAWAAMMAARRRWRRAGTGLAVAIVGVIALIAGPVGAWLVLGIGLCVALLGSAAVIVWRQRRRVVES